MSPSPPISIFLTLILVIGQPLGWSASPAPQRPNVLMIAVDDLNTWISPLQGHPQAHTPNLDRLANRGVLFSNAHCSAPACNPSRTSVMTGLRPSSSGVYFNWQDWRLSSRLRNITTLPAHFRNHGYTVLGAGKLYHAASLSQWGHEGYLDPEPWHQYFPSKQRQLPTEVRPEPFPLNGSEQFYRGFFDWAPLPINDEAMGDAKVVTWAESQLSSPSDRPFFLAVGLYRPHIPWYTPRSHFDRYPLESIVMPNVKESDLDDVPKAGQAMARRSWHQWMTENHKWQEAVQAYLASVTFADAMIGRLVQALDHGPHAKNTVIILWSDHGYHLGHKEHWEKFALWEQTTQVPMIISAPGIEGGTRCHHPVSLLDIYPTLATLCQLPVLPHLEGRNLVPSLQQPQSNSDRAVITTQGPKNHAIRNQHWRYIRYADGSEELYDHRTDPNEFNNLAQRADLQPVIRELSAKLPHDDAPLSPSTRRKNKP